MENSNKKTCNVCFQEIDFRAKKCPYCHHWQNSSMAIRHSIFALLPVFGLMLFGVALLIMGHMVFRPGEPFEKHRGDLQIKESQMMFGDVGATSVYPTIAVLGTFKNTGRFSWKDINVEVRFFDADGKLVDGGQQKTRYSFEAPAGAGGEAVFKVSITRELPQERYKSYKIKILSAIDAKTWP